MQLVFLFYSYNVVTTSFGSSQVIPVVIWIHPFGIGFYSAIRCGKLNNYNMNTFITLSHRSYNFKSENS